MRTREGSVDAVLFLRAASEGFCLAVGKAAADREYEWRRIGHESLLVISMCQIPVMIIGQLE